MDASKAPLLETGEAYEKGDYTVPGTGCKAMISLPLRFALWVVLMCTIYPLWLSISLIVATVKKLYYGKPSNILEYGSMGFPLGGMYYPAMMVFNKPFDKEKLQKHFLKMGEEADIPAEKMRLTFEDEVPRPFPTRSGAIEQDHYVETGTNWLREHGKKHDGGDISTTGMGRGALCWLRVFNGKAGDPTVVNIGLNGNVWDGSSCFNFMKELVHRHTTGQANDVFRTAQQKRLPIKPESAAKFDEGWFVCFLLRMLLHVTTNAAYLFWNALRTPKCFGGCGMGPMMVLMPFDGNLSQFALINFDQADSTALAEGCKKVGMKPFAAMTYAAVHAYKEIVGADPHRITQQSSLQTRHFGEEGQKERDFVGDWLLGPLQYPSKQYTPEDAMEGYKTLLWDLDNVGPSVREAFWCKAYGVFSSGAGIFEGPFFYPGDMRLPEAVFFNNYGIRSMHPDSGFVTWNWGAPFRLGFNTICVNGRTTITCASSLLGLPTLRAIRDRAEETLRVFMRGERPTCHLKYA